MTSPVDEPCAREAGARDRWLSIPQVDCLDMFAACFSMTSYTGVEAVDANKGIKS